MVTVLALGAALAYGVADFMGGAASRRVAVLRVLLLSVPAGVVFLAVASLVAGEGPSVNGLAWGGAAGVLGGAGLIGFYKALAQGPMSVVAPVSALTAAVLPVAVGVVQGERLDTRVLAGVVLCVLAIGLVSMEERKPSLQATMSSGPFLAAISGAAFGTFFVLLHQAGDDSGLWPTTAARVAGLAVVLIALLAARRPLEGKFTKPVLALALVSGMLDGLANALYFIAAREGLLSLAAVLTSLYPAITVLLARLVYAERLRTVQRVGLAVAATGITLVTVG
jgi:drug/metabolite transporter (DMT)-like permease